MRDGRPCCAGCHGTAWGVVAVGVCDIGNWAALAGVALRNGLAVLVVLNAAVAAAGATAADVPADVDALAAAAGCWARAWVQVREAREEGERVRREGGMHWCLPARRWMPHLRCRMPRPCACPRTV